MARGSMICRRAQRKCSPRSGGLTVTCHKIGIWATKAGHEQSGREREVRNISFKY